MYNLLRAFHVKLRLARRIGRMKRDQLNAHQVVTRRNARRHREVGPPLVGDHVVDAPYAVVQTVFGHLEPFQAGSSGGGCVVNLCEVYRNRSFFKFYFSTYRLT